MELESPPMLEHNAACVVQYHFLQLLLCMCVRSYVESDVSVLFVYKISCSVT